MILNQKNMTDVAVPISKFYYGGRINMQQSILEINYNFDEYNKFWQLDTENWKSQERARRTLVSAVCGGTKKKKKKLGHQRKNWYVLVITRCAKWNSVVIRVLLTLLIAHLWFTLLELANQCLPILSHNMDLWSCYYLWHTYDVLVTNLWSTCDQLETHLWLYCHTLVTNL